MSSSFVAEGPTPEFLAWCVAKTCRFRSEQQAISPLATERRLKSLRAVGQARLEGRCFEGICLDRPTANGTSETPYGFPESEVVTLLGGVNSIQSECVSCPGNVATVNRSSDEWAGCFGWVVAKTTSGDEVSGSSGTVAAVESVLASDSKLSSCLADLFHVTRPRWYGLWLERRVTSEACGPLADCLESSAKLLTEEIDSNDNLNLLGLRRLADACRQAAEHQLDLQVELVPAGKIEGKNWWWPQRCERCQRPRPRPQDPCKCCGNRSAPLARRKRKTRGNRPFIPLPSFMGREEADALLERFRARNTKP